MEDREPDLPGLLRWAASAEAARYLAAPADLRAAARTRLVGDPRPGGRLGPRRRRVRRRPRRPGPGPGLRGRLRRGGRRRARAAGGRRPAGALPQQPADRAGRRPDAGQGRAATPWTTWPATSPRRPRATCCGPTRCSGTSRPRPLAHLGRRTPLAWEARLRRLARSLADAAEPAGGEDLPTCEAEFRSLVDHALSASPPYRDRLGRAGMALRLARWLRTPEDDSGSLRGSSPAATSTSTPSSTGHATPWPAATSLPELTDAFARIGRAGGRAAGRVQPGVRGGAGRLDRAAAPTPARSSASRTSRPRRPRRCWTSGCPSC